MSFEDQIRALVRAELAIALAGLGAGDYTSVDGQRPNRVTRRAFAVRCRSGAVAGAVLEGKAWRCSRSAWHASFAQRAAPALSIVPELVSDDEALAEAALEAAGLRATRRAS